MTCSITADRDAWRGAVTEREAALVEALERFREVCSDECGKWAGHSFIDAADLHAAYQLAVQVLTARAHTAAEGERPNA